MRTELERLARLYKSQFYLSCVLVNSAEDLHLAGDLQVALKKAYDAFGLDTRHRPEDSDTAVTYEILARILLECYLLSGCRSSSREILVAVRLLILGGLDLAAEWPEQRACLQSLLAVVKSNQGDRRSAKALLDKCMSYSTHYEKSENIFWHHIHKAMVEVRFDRTDEVRGAFALAIQMSQRHLYRRFYADRLRVVLWPDQPDKWRLNTDDISSLAETGGILRGELM
ncbi:MAG: hypothetical protein JXN61_13445 [Sedimentisphaerales bacterium]|nr:hypothetical protein [Sedimentisphaerales bacterium]